MSRHKTNYGSLELIRVNKHVDRECFSCVLIYLKTSILFIAVTTEQV